MLPHRAARRPILIGLCLLPGLAQAHALDAQATGVWLAGLLAGQSLALTLFALGHRWNRGLLLMAGAGYCWSGLLSQHQAGDPVALGLQLLLGLCLLAMLVLETGRGSERLSALAACGVLAAWALAWLVPEPWAKHLQGVVPALLGLALLGTAAYLLWLRWQLWTRDGLESWAAVIEQLRCTVLPLLLATSAGGHLLHGAGRGDLPWSVGLLLLVLGGAQLGSLGRRKVQLENRLRQTDVQMQERINELDRHHQLLADQRLEQVTERERKRIAGDLHDDLGAKLLTIVHTSDNERISTLAREALEEMRLSVRGLTGRPVQLLDAIGDWRAEVVSRLTQSNIEAEWLSLAEEVSHTLPARAYVQTTRVLREAVSNVIKHSGATRCVVRCQLADGDFQLIIQDNGRGVPTEKDGRLDRGHGMASMKSRAKQMQGQCLVESGPGWGTLIRLTIPL
jgi:two-component system sensor histidine kinase UhpB